MDKRSDLEQHGLIELLLQEVAEEITAEDAVDEAKVNFETDVEYDLYANDWKP